MISCREKRRNKGILEDTRLLWKKGKKKRQKITSGVQEDQKEKKEKAAKKKKFNPQVIHPMVAEAPVPRKSENRKIDNRERI